MTRYHLLVLAYGITLLLLLQVIATLVESVYVLELLGTGLDIRAAAVLFLLSPVLLLLLGRQAPGAAIWTFGLALIAARAATPMLGTSGRLLTSGIGAAAGLMLLPLLLARQPEVSGQPGWPLALGLGLAVGGSILLRTLGFSFDLSLTSGGAWIGWALGALLLALLPRFAGGSTSPAASPARGAFWPAVGLVMALTLAYFALAAPAVIARWTQGNYRAIVALVSLAWLGTAALAAWRPSLLERLPRSGLDLWNALFLFALLGTILAHRVAFPATPDAAPVVVGAPTAAQQLPLYAMLLLSPVILLDAMALAGKLVGASPLRLAGGFAIGALLLLVLVFVHIFSNTWGYVPPVSPFFRNKFWLPYLVPTLLLAFAAWRAWAPRAASTAPTAPLAYALLSCALLTGTLWGVWRTGRVVAAPPADPNRLVVMTYNIQQGVDGGGERAQDRQLALMRRANADVIALQESDSARVSLGNVDLALYYAHHLGYHGYYGPKTVAGTYGTAILSRYPLENARSVFTYSDKDEDGTAEVELVAAGQRFTVYNVHPDGSPAAKLACVQSAIDRSAGRERVVVLGDFNAREGQPPYQALDALFQNAWMTAYPTGIDETGLDMSGTKRIDHIFVSADLRVRGAAYVPKPESATDHPAHWAVLGW